MRIYLLAKRAIWLWGVLVLLAFSNCNEPTVVLDVSGWPADAVRLLVQSELNGVRGQDSIFDAGSAQVVLQLPRGSNGILKLEVLALSSSGCKIARSTLSEPVPTGLRPLVELSTTLTPLYTMGCKQFSFKAATNPQVGKSPTSIALADFNHDQNLDAAVTNRDDNNVSVLFGDGTGFLGGLRNYPLGRGDALPYSVLTADFNSDQELDLVVANEVSSDPMNGTVSFLAGNGTGSFANAESFSAGKNALCLAVGDYNGDQTLDLAVANDTGTLPETMAGGLSVFLGHGDGTFINGPGSPFKVEDAPYIVIAADFNRDNILDLATANAGANYPSVLLGDGTGNFRTKPNDNKVAGAHSLATGDFNGDQNPDLVFAETSGNVKVLLNGGDGNFSTVPNSMYVANLPYGIAAADFNGDGLLDVVVTRAASTGVSFLLGNGMGGFNAPVDYPTGTGPTLVTVGDLNSDGKPDIVVANTTDTSKTPTVPGTTIAVLINQSQ